MENLNIKHLNITQGDWHTRDGQIYPQETGKTLALIPYFNEDNAEEVANAYLIAAAPNLLDCCIDTLRILELNPTLDNLYQRNKLRAAINKAIN